ncbi:MAG: ATP-binding cassette domain-containing protein [Methanomassiliicoccales archaeon]|nr:ATP-binding cassette domain-containing protein [Methanomassiliicoccales archaeon]
MVRVHVARDENHVLRGVDLRIQRGERVAVIGPNGSGKSSLIKVMMGELRHDCTIRGSCVRIRGMEHWDVFDVRRSFGLVSSDLQLELRRDMSGEEAVASGAFGSIGTNRSQDLDDGLGRRAMEALKEVGAGHLASRKVRSLSTGEARRVLMARALVNRPEALVLDEPMTSLDLIGKRMVTRAIRSAARGGRGLVLVTHDPSEIVPEIERVVMLKEGRIFLDAGIESMDDESLSALYGVPVHVRRVDGRYLAWS